MTGWLVLHLEFGHLAWFKMCIFIKWLQVPVHWEDMTGKDPPSDEALCLTLTQSHSLQSLKVESKQHWPFHWKSLMRELNFGKYYLITHHIDQNSHLHLTSMELKALHLVKSELKALSCLWQEHALWPRSSQLRNCSNLLTLFTRMLQLLELRRVQTKKKSALVCGHEYAVNGPKSQEEI